MTNTPEKTEMFKDYKAIFKDLRKIQDKLWQDSMASFPGATFPRGMETWQKDTLNNVNNLVGQAIRQSMDLQREWLSQWSERASGKNLKPKTFAELSAEARQSTERWLENQNQLWDQWLKLLSGNNMHGKLPGFAEWEKAMQESMQAQMDLLQDWSDMTDFKKLSNKEFSKLSNQIVKAMDKSISTQQRLWSHWFDRLQGVGKAATAAEPRQKAKPTAKKKAVSGTKPAKASGKSAVAVDDLKQIAGIGPGLEKKLKDSGISTLHELAGLDDHDIARLEEDVIRFSGRIKRDKWVEQAKKLIS
jgi:predicted flap endonuclease-1-like 5' DNA nuclease